MTPSALVNFTHELGNLYFEGGLLIKLTKVIFLALFLFLAIYLGASHFHRSLSPLFPPSSLPMTSLLSSVPNHKYYLSPCLKRLLMKSDTINSAAAVNINKTGT